MSLTLLVVWQLVLDVVLLVAVIALMAQRRAPKRVPVPRPPVWYGELVELAQGLMAATDQVTRALEARRSTPVVGPALHGAELESAPHAWAMVRGGLAPEEAARRGGLPPAELRLLRSVVAAAAEPPTA